MEEEYDIQIRSDEVEDILGRPPSWIVRWGTTVIFLTLGILVAISWLVEYSDIIEASIEITTPSPPMNVVAETNGRLEELNVKTNDQVEQGTVVAVIESSADYKDILWLDEKVEKFRTSKKSFNLNKKLKLGEVQFAYSTFRKDFKDYTFRESSTFSKQQVEQLSKRIRGIQNKMGISNDRYAGLDQQINLVKQKLGRYQGMLSEGVVAQQAVDDIKAELAALANGRQDIRSEIANFQGEIDRLEGQKLEIQRGKVEGSIDKWTLAQESLNKLAGEISAWKKKYIITAPVSGKVTLFDIRTEQQYVNLGDEIMMIVPEQEEIIGRVQLPVAGAGKVQKNQDVNILLHEFPSREFGVVRGKVTSISILSKDNAYLVQVSLPNGLETTYKKTLTFKQKMSGVAEIKTDERKFLLRIFDKFADLFMNKSSIGNSDNSN